MRESATKLQPICNHTPTSSQLLICMHHSERKASLDDGEDAESSEGSEGGPAMIPMAAHAHVPTVIKRGLSHSDSFMATVIGDLDMANGNIFSYKLDIKIIFTY